jgi:ABC-type lipoprotein release transport system permease subunit
MTELPGSIARHWALFWAALEAAVRHPVRFWTTAGCLVAVATPFLAGTAILEGVRAEAAASVEAGPDLLVTGYEYGRSSSLPEELVARCRRMEGVREARGRIVGRSYAGEQVLTVVGLGDGRGEAGPRPGQVWLGAALARDLRVAAGGWLTLADQAELPVQVERLLPAGAGLASARLVVLGLADAQRLFATPGRISDLQLWVEPGAEQHSGRLLHAAFQLRMAAPALRIQTRKLAADYVDRGLTLKGGTFYALYLVALGVLIPALLVTSGFGMSARRREIGLMRALGFSLLDVLEMALHEIAILSTLSSLAAFLLAWLWLRVAGGFLVAPFFIAGLEQGAPLQLPVQFFPLPVLVVFALCWVLLATGVIGTTVRAATAPPMEALR